MPLTASKPESTANSTAGYRVPASAFNVPESRMSFGMETRFLSEVSGSRTVTKPRSSNKPFSRRFPESRSGSVGETSVPSSEREAIPGTATSAGAMRSRPSVPKDRLRHEAFCRRPDFSKCRRPETDARFRANRRRLSDSGEAVPAETDRERMRRPKHRHGRRRRRSEAGNPSGTTGRCPFRNVLSWNGLSSRYAPRETTGRRRSGQRCPDCRSNRQPNSIGKRPNG